MICHWYNNNIKIRKGDLNHAPKGKPGSWNYRKVVGQMYKDDIQETIKDIAKEKDYDGDKSHIALYQQALTRMVASVEKDQERDDEIEQLVVKWNRGPPPSVQAK